MASYYIYLYGRYIELDRFNAPVAVKDMGSVEIYGFHRHLEGAYEAKLLDTKWTAIGKSVFVVSESGKIIILEGYEGKVFNTKWFGTSEVKTGDLFD
jgi:hypothetical protein